jgi:hypothetical protein
MKKKESWCFEKIAVLALAVVLAVSFVAMAAYTAGEKKAEITAFPKGEGIRGSGPGATKGVVWDNGMWYENLLTAQIESDPAGLDSEPADDFMFDVDQLVNDVHWIGGYYNGPPNDGDFDWRVTFYNDDGTGTRPGAVFATWDFPNAQVNETFIEYTNPSDPDYGAYYSYSVTLPTTLTFIAGTKYWISIQGLGDTAPQSGWGIHSDQILLHEAVFRSVYFSLPDWTDITALLGYPADMCFQLTFEGEEWPNHKMHFPQEPDLIGWDVNATDPKTLADDWQCSESGPVTDIHFWGSWKDIDGDPTTDDFFTPMPFFRLSIHSNLPVGHPQNPYPYSIPGDLLWMWEGEIEGVPSEPPTMEAWYDPNMDSSFCNDHIPYWRYDFFFDQASPTPEPFYQLQDSIYWLDISALYIQPPYQWGWKNSRDHFMDDAVYMDAGGPWIEMYEPPRCNWFDVYFNEFGEPEDMGSTNYYGQGWYFYEMYGWWNMWFYDNPFTYDHLKEIHMDFYVDPVGTSPFVEFAVNWSTDIWYYEGVPDRPPLPQDGNEDLFIGREIIPVEFGPNLIDYTIPYNPEWVSIDFIAQDVVINGWIYHECVQTSMDLAFVITGEECTPSIDVEKKVWDEDLQDWVDSVDVNVCNNVDFLITIVNDGTCDLTSIVAEDFMDASLEFLDATPFPDSIEPVPGGTYAEWRFPGPLTPGSTIDINVTAHVVGPACHLDSNYVFVHGAYEPQAIEVYDEDAAYVHATEEPWPDHKMHYPQLPDPEGWDVVATQGYEGHPGIVAADDFMCMESGRITDVHLWGSWLYDMEMPVMGFWLSIHENIPGPPYSMPGEELWSAYVTDFAVVPEAPGLQGWYDPFAPWWEYPNHEMYFRYDITNLPNPFCQDSGNIYWLNVMADIGPPGYMGFPEPPLWGWKTSGSPHFEDDAVWAVWTPPAFDWIPLEDPNTGMTLDLSFVLTAEEALCGDVNHSGAVEGGDVVFLISYLFRGGPAPCPLIQGDVNCDGTVTGGDVVYLISYLFRGGPPPCDTNGDGIPDC